MGKVMKKDTSKNKDLIIKQENKSLATLENKRNKQALIREKNLNQLLLKRRANIPQRYYDHEKKIFDDFKNKNFKMDKNLTKNLPYVVIFICLMVAISGAFPQIMYMTIPLAILTLTLTLLNKPNKEPEIPETTKKLLIAQAKESFVKKMVKIQNELYELNAPNGMEKIQYPEMQLLLENRLNHGK